eukprot:TRINITY_DN6795_c0_g1_i1.p1 TRINITY_DN6795_c0_g1~~TRINITY_DN6795_c0_g1_i1.p1  ORF type:complete len:1023 (+),score=152.99 TRINITY_DN6795_c0_g1_i1:337-3069(+)
MENGSEQHGDVFYLIASSTETDALDTAAGYVETELIKAALADDSNSVEVAVEPSGKHPAQLATSTVRRKGDLHGVLLIEFGQAGPFSRTSSMCDETRSPTVPAWAYPSVTAETLTLHPAAMVVRLLAMTLAECLSEMRQESQVVSLQQSLESVRKTLHQVLDIVDKRGSTANLEDESSPAGYEDAMNLAGSMVQEDLLYGNVAADVSALWQYDGATKHLVRKEGGKLGNFRIMAQHSLVGDAIQNDGKLACTRNAPLDSRVRSSADTATNLRTRSSIAIPLPQVSDACMGTNVLQLQRYSMTENSVFHHFDIAEAEDLQKSSLATLLQIQEELVALFEAEREREALRNIVTSLSQSETVIELAAHIEREIPDVMFCERCTFFFVDNTAGEVWAPAISSRPKFICCKFGEGLVGHVVHEASRNKLQNVLTVNDPKACSLWAGDVAEGFVTHNVMTAPVFSAGKKRQVTGVIQILNKRSHDTQRNRRSFQSRSVVSSQTEGTEFCGIDERLLELLCEGVSVHLDRLLVDIMCVKACINESVTDLITATLMNEYYQTSEMRNSQVANDGSSLRVGPKSTRQDVVELFKLDEIPSWANITNWELDYWGLTVGQEFQLFLQALNLLDVPGSIAVPQINLHNFYTNVRNNYRALPYHNFHHALSVIHYSAKLALVGDMLPQLSGELRFALLVSALCHDVDHRGCNNAFEVVSRSELAIRYNDNSPLESHSAAKSFELAFSKGPGTSSCNIFGTFDSETYTTVRHIIISAILSTDMKCHGTHLKKLQTLESASIGAAPASDDARIVMVESVLHSADIGNPFMPKDICMKWSKRVHEEFTMQVEKERTLGLPVTVFMDGLTDPVKAAKSQVGFVCFVVQPLVEILVTCFPTLHDIKAVMLENVKTAKAVAESGTAPST